MPTRKPPLSAEDQAARDTAQLDRFKEAARALECDDDETRFDKRMRTLAKAPPAPKPSKRPKKPEC